ncbi:MAG: hypothetical protein NTZ78_15080 [Candidatus Aureabacteria bacterium]|nr:hypothetical protein [Candidatus Auribacterota bacterium]
MKNEQLQSLDVATKQRRKYFCASIEDRIRGNVWGEPTIIMTKKAIELVEVDSKSLLIRITHEGKHFLAAVGDAYQAKQAIDELVEGTITDRSDPECINLRIPPPQELLSIFATNRECDSALSEKLHVVSRHDEYMNTLFDEFDNKCNRIQQLTLRSLAKGPPEFARAFVRRLSDSSRQMRNYYLVGALLSLPSVVSLFWLVPLHLPGTTEEPGWLFFPDIIVIAGLFCGTFLLARGWINHHRLEALLSCVRGIALTGQFEQESLSPASELPNSAKT